MIGYRGSRVVVTDRRVCVFRVGIRGGVRVLEFIFICRRSGLMSEFWRKLRLFLRFLGVTVFRFYNLR